MRKVMHNGRLRIVQGVAVVRHLKQVPKWVIHELLTGERVKYKETKENIFNMGILIRLLSNFQTANF